MPQGTAAQELQIKAEARLASLMQEKLVTRISVLSTLLGGGKTTERLLVRISTETHKTSPDFDQTAADKAKNRIKQALNAKRTTVNVKREMVGTSMREALSQLGALACERAQRLSGGLGA